MKTKDWEDIEPVWQEYAQEQFGECVNHVYQIEHVEHHNDRRRGTGWRTSGQGRSKTNSKTSLRTRNGRGGYATPSGHHRHQT